jgi:hypothetical protein
MSAHVNPRVAALKASVGIVPKDDQHTRGNGRSGVDFEPSLGWVNLVLPIAIKREDGTEEITYLSVGGMPIDKLKHFKTNGSNPETVQRNTASNHLQDQIHEALAGMQAGEEMILSRLVVQLRKVRPNDVSAADPTVNPFMAGLLSA